MRPLCLDADESASNGAILIFNGTAAAALSFIQRLTMYITESSISTVSTLALGFLRYFDASKQCSKDVVRELGQHGRANQGLTLSGKSLYIHDCSEL